MLKKISDVEKDHLIKGLNPTHLIIHEDDLEEIIKSFSVVYKVPITKKPIEIMGLKVWISTDPKDMGYPFVIDLTSYHSCFNLKHPTTTR